jgi:hypothetical protein
VSASFRAIREGRRIRVDTAFARGVAAGDMARQLIGVRKKQLATLVVFIMVASACRKWVPVPTVDTVRTQNRENLSRLVVGQDKATVLQVMGTETIETYSAPALASGRFYGPIPEVTRMKYRDQRINNPYRTETSRTPAGIPVEILFYYTDRKADGGVTNDELTPLVLEEGVLVGWGWSYLDRNVEKYQIEMRSR